MERTDKHAVNRMKRQQEKKWNLQTANERRVNVENDQPFTAEAQTALFKDPVHTAP